MKKITTNATTHCCGRQSVVMDSRLTGSARRRRRRCVKCGRRWTTYEVAGLVSRASLLRALAAIDQTHRQLAVIERDLTSALEYAVDVHEEDADESVD
jgi:transcriptional regulator NrdR family protein